MQALSHLTQATIARAFVGWRDAARLRAALRHTAVRLLARWRAGVAAAALAAWLEHHAAAGAKRQALQGAVTHWQHATEAAAFSCWQEQVLPHLTAQAAFSTQMKQQIVSPTSDLPVQNSLFP